MIHDICHCTGEGCSKKDNCHRYIAHLEVQQRGLEYISYFVNPPYKDGDCDCFWAHW